MLKECGKIYTKLRGQDEAYPKDFGVFPQTVYIFYLGGSLRKPADHFDVSRRLMAWRMSGDECEELSDISVQCSAEPRSGMYFHHGSFAFCISDDGKTAKIDMWLGPRYGRGFVYDIKEEYGAVCLANQRVRWVS